MRVTTDELRKAMEVLLKHLDDTGQFEFELEEDFYWSVPQETRYDVYTPPTELSVGQLTDDWVQLQGIIKGKSEPLGYGLVWASAVLRAVGEKAVG